MSIVYRKRYGCEGYSDQIRPILPDIFFMMIPLFIGKHILGFLFSKASNLFEPVVQLDLEFYAWKEKKSALLYDNNGDGYVLDKLSCIQIISKMRTKEEGKMKGTARKMDPLIFQVLLYFVSLLGSLLGWIKCRSVR